jgi:uncharacterized protein DUF4160
MPPRSAADGAVGGYPRAAWGVIRVGRWPRTASAKSTPSPGIDYAYSVVYRVPTVLRIGPYRFHFFANEGTEPAHIHVRGPNGECKFWLEPVLLSDGGSVRAQELRAIERLVRENQEQLLRSWNDFHR